MKRYSVLPFFLLAFTMHGLAKADLKVRIFDSSASAPLADASVCLGTPANVAQFGSAQTDNDGYVVFSSFPRAPLVVTASKTGFRSEQQSIVTGSSSRLLMLSLTRGGGGARCLREFRSSVSGGGSVQVGSFRLGGGSAAVSGAEVTLDNSVNGQPTHYRASESSDFSGAAWKVWSKSPTFMLSEGAGEKTVYFQVRRQSTINGADIETRSPVVKDSITRQ